MKSVFYLRNPNDFILEAMFTASPNRLYLNMTVPTIPADTDPVNDKKKGNRAAGKTVGGTKILGSLSMPLLCPFIPIISPSNDPFSLSKFY